MKYGIVLIDKDGIIGEVMTPEEAQAYSRFLFTRLRWEVEGLDKLEKKQVESGLKTKEPPEWR
jgi:hypothetical protein